MLELLEFGDDLLSGSQHPRKESTRLGEARFDRVKPARAERRHIDTRTLIDVRRERVVDLLRLCPQKSARSRIRHLASGGADLARARQNRVFNADAGLHIDRRIDPVVGAVEPLAKR